MLDKIGLDEKDPEGYRLRTDGKGRLAQRLEDVLAELWQLIEKGHTVVGRRHLARHGRLAATDQPGIGDRVMRPTKGTNRNQRCAGARQASDAVDIRGLDGFRQAHRRQDGREPPCQDRLTRPELSF